MYIACVLTSKQFCVWLAWISSDYFESLLLPQWEEKTTWSNRMNFRLVFDVWTTSDMTSVAAMVFHFAHQKATQTYSSFIYIIY